MSARVLGGNRFILVEIIVLRCIVLARAYNLDSFVERYIEDIDVQNMFEKCCCFRRRILRENSKLIG